MGGDPVANILREHPVTKDLSTEHIQAVAGCATFQALTAGEYLWRQGDQTPALHLLQSGQVALEIFVPGQGPLRIEILHDGEILGCSNLIPERRCQFDARALTPVHCLKLDSGYLRELMERDPKLGYELFKLITPLVAQKLEAARLRLFDQPLALTAPVSSRRK